MSSIKLSRRARFPLAALLALTIGLVWTSFAMADAGNPILGTIKASTTETPTTVTIYVRGQWNWISHGSDCNTDRAATGVGIIWNDRNGATGGQANEIQRITLSGTTAGATYTLKWKKPDGTNVVSGTLNSNDTAAAMKATLESASFMGAGNAGVTGGFGSATPLQWFVEFKGAYAGLNVNALATQAKSGGLNINYATTQNSAVGEPYNGWLVSNGAISAFVGYKNPTAEGGGVDRMVHPVDRGNQVEGYTAAGDFPAGQAFVDPASNDPVAGLTTWRGGCGRTPISATASKNAPGGGPNNEATGRNCAGLPPSGNTLCANHPWGSWGYEKTGAKIGYSHTYRKVLADGSSGLPDKVCVNFYDVHGGGSVTSTSFQKPNNASEITVDGNGDNSIDTNAFNVFDTSAGASNCISLITPALTTDAGLDAVVNTPIHDTGTLSGLPAAGAGGTITFTLWKRPAAATQPDCQTTLVFTSAAIPVTGNGSYSSGNFTPTSTGTYDWKAVYSGDSANLVLGAEAPCGDQTPPNDETIEITKQPTTVITNAGPTRLLGFLPGSTVTLTDSATLSGGFGPTGTITFSLWRNDPNCTPGSEFPGTPHTKPVDSGNATYTSNGIVVSQPGTYYWIANYSGDGNNSGTSNGCQGANETVLVIRPEIDVTKNPKNQSVPSGGTANFTIEVTNTGDTRLTGITVSDAQAPGCARTAAQTKVLIEGKYTAPHDFLDPTESFTYDCSKSPVTAAFINVVEACGDVVENPPGGNVCDTDDTGTDPNCPEPDRCGSVEISNLTTEQDFKPRDTGTLSGLVGTPGGTLTFSLFKDAACTQQLDLSSGASMNLTATVNANAAYTVESDNLLSTMLGTTNTDGTYYWQVSYSGDAASNNAAITGNCGTENFSVDND